MLIITLMQYFKSFDGEKIAYKVHHQPNNPTDSIIIVHGFGGDVAFLDDLVDELIKENGKKQIISLILRGHSFSSKTFPQDEEYLEEVHAKDLQMLINHLKTYHPILIGHSLGGIIIQSYLNQNLLPNPRKAFFICSTTQMMGINILRKNFYKILTNTPNGNDHFKTKNKPFYNQFKNGWDIDFRRFLHDTTVIGSLFLWFLHFLSIHGWQNNDIKQLNNKNYYYIFGKNDIIVPSFKQYLSLKDLNKLNKIEINSGHISPITDHIELAKLINKYL
ncbi:MAG: alpha/beta hydrolase [Candidatus Pacebacteria bacterium]|nr:alpha/beta hydrolase [Candidatus Paceibacterota bacterium]